MDLQLLRLQLAEAERINDMQRKAMDEAMAKQEQKLRDMQNEYVLHVAVDLLLLGLTSLQHAG